MVPIVNQSCERVGTMAHSRMSCQMHHAPRLPLFRIANEQKVTAVRRHAAPELYSTMCQFGMASCRPFPPPRHLPAFHLVPSLHLLKTNSLLHPSTPPPLPHLFCDTTAAAPNDAHVLEVVQAELIGAVRRRL